jgi:hypothetical protein
MWSSVTSDASTRALRVVRGPPHIRCDDSIRSGATKGVSDGTVTDDVSELSREILTICDRLDGHERTDAHVKPFSHDPNSARAADARSKMSGL